MILVLGGARSGKSSYAEESVKKHIAQEGGDVLYVATSIAFDEDMQDRVKKHQEARPSHWHTLEQYKGFNTLEEHPDFQKSKVVMLDCVTLMVSNLLLDYPVDFDHIPRHEIDQMEGLITKEVKDFVTACQKHHKHLILVSNEVGLGIVPAYRLGSIFRDIAGRMNQLLAREADEVYFLVSGIPMKIK
ncbi:MAG: bifunctional adenosylcobinamide kinase/adenosylcobinamide-phosphate guanylyltransferase [Niameybacter sp.]|uniref:bifunctional adenosylcobinamide kinase/adenosylcobinamide-phosphate guanylyltransferase n=1 Tax=Niameybacter sp. TaxID=2033640 RepID=UPI002FC58F6C